MGASNATQGMSGRSVASLNNALGSIKFSCPYAGYTYSEGSFGLGITSVDQNEYECPNNGTAWIIDSNPNISSDFQNRSGCNTENNLYKANVGSYRIDAGNQVTQCLNNQWEKVDPTSIATICNATPDQFCPNGTVTTQPFTDSGIQFQQDDLFFDSSPNKNSGIRAKVYDSNIGTPVLLSDDRTLHYFVGLTQKNNIEVISGSFLDVELPYSSVPHCKLSNNTLDGDAICKMGVQVYYSVTKALSFFSSFSIIDFQNKYTVCIQCSDGASQAGGLKIRFLSFSDDDIKNHLDPILQFLSAVSYHETTHIAQSSPIYNDKMRTIIVSGPGTNLTEGLANFFAGVLSGQTIVGHHDIDEMVIFDSKIKFGRETGQRYSTARPLTSVLSLIVRDFFKMYKEGTLNYKIESNQVALQMISNFILRAYFESDSDKNFNFITYIKKFKSLVSPVFPMMEEHINLHFKEFGLDLSQNQYDAQTQGLVINGRGLVVDLPVIINDILNGKTYSQLNFEVQKGFINDSNFQGPFLLWLYSETKNYSSVVANCVNPKLQALNGKIKKELALISDPQQKVERLNTILKTYDTVLTASDLSNSKIMQGVTLRLCAIENGLVKVNDAANNLIGQIDLKNSGSKYSSTVPIDKTISILLNTDFSINSYCERKAPGAIGAFILDRKGQIAADFALPYFICK